MSVGATQCRDVLVNVVETETQKELSTWLKNYLFTASVDESTDCRHQKVFSITVRIADFDRGTIKNTFLDIPLVFKQGEDASSKSDRLFEIIIIIIIIIKIICQAKISTFVCFIISIALYYISFHFIF